MQYLVTGATGFVGSHLVRELLKTPEATVIALIRKEASIWRLKEIQKKLILIEVDFLNYKELFSSIGQFSPKICFHLGWEGVLNNFRNDPIQKKNILILQNLLNLIKEIGIETFIGMGSQAEYGIKNHSIKEDEKLEPITLYGIEKVKAYELTKSYCEKHSIKYNWLRLFSCYGPMDNPIWLIPYVIRELLANKTPLLTEGFQQWDYLYIDDVVKAIMASISIKESGVFNLGSGLSVSIREVVGVIYDIINPGVKPFFGTLSVRKDQQHYLQADITKLLAKNVWKPSISLIEGLLKTIQY